MTRWLKCASAMSFVVSLTMATAGRAAAQDTLAAARELYASAAYEDALAVLNRLRAPTSRDEGRTIDQYRAFCLLALGRAAEADTAIEAVVTAEPSYRPADADVSPRVRTAFSDVRKRMLPVIIQQKYAQAKAAFDRKEFAAAADGFSQVLSLMTEPDIASAAKQPPLSDLRTLAVGFNDLSRSAAAPPPAAPPPPPPAPPPPVQAIAAPVVPAQPAIVAAPRVYDATDSSVVPPIVVRQVVPPFTLRVVPTTQGMVEVIVNELGAVEMASILMPLSRLYDQAVLEAAKNWIYRPATLNGVPVKYRKDIRISFK
jgi:tetratricopeptide (TPR) repeat protein